MLINRKKVGSQRYKNSITKPQKRQAAEMQCTILSESKGRGCTTGVKAEIAVPS